MRRLPVRVRLTLWYSLVMAAVLVGFGVSLRYIVRRSVLGSVDRDLADLAHSYSFHWSRRDPIPAPVAPPGGGLLLGTAPPRNRYRWRAFDRDQRELDPYGGDDPPWDLVTYFLSLGGLERYSSITADGEDLRVFSVPLWRDGEVEDVLQYAHSLDEQERLDRRLVRTLAALIPLALLVVAIGGAILTERALRPVRQITHAAAQIGVEDLSQRLAVVGHDELSELASTFNGMIGRLQEAFQRLEAAYEQQRRFTADASHELRTPLTTIKANTSLALCSEPSLDLYAEAIREADEAADRMERIVQDLVLLARSDGGRLVTSLEPLPLREILERAVAAGRYHDSAPIRLELPPEPVLVPGDRDPLTRLFLNLLDNAARHTPLDGTITVTALHLPGDAESEIAGDGAGTVEVRVTDTGEGIAPEHLPHLCERFYRVDAARSRGRGGTGLGLSICQSIVEGHHGTLRIESEVGRGTTVIVRLPGARGTLPSGDGELEFASGAALAGVIG